MNEQELILVIDPGWTCMGMVMIYCDFDNKIRKIEKIINLGVSESNGKEITAENYWRLFRAAFSDLRLVNFEAKYLIIEKQASIFKRNRRLMDLLVMFLCTEHDFYKVIYVSPIVLKNAFGLKCNGEHHMNKQDASEYVANNKELVLGGRKLNHNIADCVLMLNWFLQGHKRIAADLIQAEPIGDFEWV